MTIKLVSRINSWSATQILKSFCGFKYFEYFEYFFEFYAWFAPGYSIYPYWQDQQAYQSSFIRSFENLSSIEFENH